MRATVAAKPALQKLITDTFDGRLKTVRGDRHASKDAHQIATTEP